MPSDNAQPPRSAAHDAVGKVFAALRECGIDVKSRHRRDATGRLNVLRRVHAGRDVRVVIDCGAHVGVMTRAFHAAFPAATVYAFEPTPRTFEVLRSNLRGLERAEAINAAAGAAPGTLDLYLVEGQDQSNSLVKPPEGASSVRVPVVTIGDFCRERGIGHIDVLKMDVEGYELRVLEGLEGMLRAQEVDAILSEVRFERAAPGGTDFLELAGYLRGFGYRFFGFYEPLYTRWLQIDWCDIILVSDRMLERLRA